MKEVSPKLVGSNGEFSGLSENQLLKAKSLFLMSVNSWTEGDMSGIQSIRNKNKKIRPIYRVDQDVPEGGVTVLFEKIDGPIEDSEFILRDVVVTDAIDEVMLELASEGYQIYPALSVVAARAEQVLFKAA